MTTDDDPLRERMRVRVDRISWFALLFHLATA